MFPLSFQRTVIFIQNTQKIPGTYTIHYRSQPFRPPQELKERYEAIKGLHLDSEYTKPLVMEYKGGEAARYYFQNAAIRAALEKIARGEKKILLSLATGTGKTIIATQYWVVEK
jgi:type I site-specific restriction endonuclease